MHAVSRSVLRGLATASILSTSALAGVITVAPNGGADFTQIDAAVGAASDGDVLLVSPGSYFGFTIDGKSLHVVADGTGIFVDGHVVVRNLQGGQRVALDGLDIQPPFTDIFTQGPAMRVEHAFGSVRIERCEIHAPTMTPGSGTCGDFASWPPGKDALFVTSSSDVVLESTLLVGGYGIDHGGQLLCLDVGSDGGRGLLVDGARVSLHDVIARGADGAQQGYGGHGGAAIEITGISDVLLSGVVAEGGDGGASEDFIGFAPIGDGGDALLAGPDAVVRVLDGVYTPGAAGYHCCWTTAPGEPKVVLGSEIDYAGGPHRFLTSSPVRAGETLSLSITGHAGDQASLLLGVLPAYLPLPGYNGVLYLDPTILLGPLALVTLTGGVANVPIPIPPLGPGLDVVTLDLQMFVLESGGIKHLTGPAQVVVLDGSL
ncbi:MAG: hypothetical protein H6825_08010 [Planctomycetes bacterium]|nr:hypothetical protein [Planctomycetota bacterium]